MSDKKLYLSLLSALPQNTLSRAVGRIMATQSPRFVVKRAVKLFADRMRINVQEAEKPLNEYASVADFFVRRLRPGSRPIDARPSSIVSPCDGVLGAHGEIQNGTLVQAKGRFYTVEALLADASLAARFEGGRYATIYLSPRHYHRIHAPAACDVTHSVYIPGRLLPVNEASIAQFDHVFSANERLVTLTEKAVCGAAAIVMVGATCVGKMSLAYDPNRAMTERARHQAYYPAIQLQKGAELGAFHFGSTVVLLFERGEFLDHVEGDELRMGQALALINTRQK